MLIDYPALSTLIFLCAIPGATANCWAQIAGPLPKDVAAVWDLDQAYRESTPTRARICINGLWHWQPADPASAIVPANRWGYFKVPGCWPGITDYMQKDCQTIHTHPSWRNQRLATVKAAWYQREITVPTAWTGRHIDLHAEYVNSYAVVYIDSKRAGEIRFPGGTVDLTGTCRPGRTHVLSLLVVALPLKGVMLSYSDSNAAREVPGSVARRGLCGDLFLSSVPSRTRLGEVTVDTSVRRGEIIVGATIANIPAETSHQLRVEVREKDQRKCEFTSPPFRASDLQEGRITITKKWMPEKLWDTHTPQNMHLLSVSLLDSRSKVIDTIYPIRFGFREFWIDGRDFYLNGTRIFLCAVPYDNAQVSAAAATYEAALDSMRRLQSFGVHAVYTHNYGCEPGGHLGFAEILRAADDAGMLLSFSQPHFSQYNWSAPDADPANGYAEHAAFYVRAARNHPSVVMYSMNHNATGYSEDMNPDLLDGMHARRTPWSRTNAQRARRAEAIVKRLDPGRIVYHHSSGNLGAMHTSNFYPNFVPIQEMSDWFEHWATQGVKPFFTCEYGAPFMWDWAMYRGWYRGTRTFGSAAVPWDFCLAEWNAQFLGDIAFRISDEEKQNLRWEARQFAAGNLWHRWDYPHRLGSRDFDERYSVLAAYLTDNWRAFRTWGVSAISPWEHHVYWKLRPGMDRNRRVALPTDWATLQRPGFSPDYLHERYECMDLAYARSDWIATPAAEAMYRNNGPVLAYIAGRPDRFTGKDHNYCPGETVTKQIIVINNSREPITVECAWTTTLPSTPAGTQTVRVETGHQVRIPVTVPLPYDLRPGPFELTMTARFEHPGGVNLSTQEDRFTLHVLAPSQVPTLPVKIALFDPKGDTTRLLSALGIRCQPVNADANLSGYDLLIIGKGTITPAGSVPDIGPVRDGLKVLVFEQTAAALEQRLGFRIAEYGLRNVFQRIPDHPLLAGLDNAHLCDWRGESTILPPRLDYQLSDRYNGAPTVRWCGLEVPRLWRCGNRGNVASVLIEKPARGDFLPILDGGFSLQYSPLMVYREGRGLVLFCQMDVTGRTDRDPAAVRLVANILSYLATAQSGTERTALYAGDPAGKQYLEHAGIDADPYRGGNLSPNHVLIFGRGGAQVLADHKPDIRRWLNAGGHLLALELDAEEVNPVLPSPVTTSSQEHIAAYFKPPARGSLLAGVGPADVHNRAPRKLPLVTGGATLFGNGVLAQAEQTHTVFCQLVPYRISKGILPLSAKPASNSGTEDSTDPRFSSGHPEQQNLRKTYRRTAFLLARLLANMGVRGNTPLLSRFATPVAPGDTSPEGRWSRGLYIDTVQEWDDPYRFFRW